MLARQLSSSPNRYDEPEALADLVAAIGQRDASALRRLYDLTVDRGFAVAMRVLENPADAEEAVCAAYHQVWERADDYCRARGGVLSWLLAIVWSRAVDLRRRRTPHLSLEALHPDVLAGAHRTDDADVAALLDAFAAGSTVQHALARLRPTVRRVLQLAFVSGLSHLEIAQCTGVPLGTVKSHIRRGLADLRRTLLQQGVADD